MSDIPKLYPKPSSPCNCTNIIRASRAVILFYDKMLKPSGISIQQMRLLNVVKSGKASTMSALAKTVRIDRTTLNRNLKPLIEADMIEVRQGKDARTKQIYLTDNGSNAMAKAAALWKQAQQDLQNYLGDSEQQHLTSLLSKLEALVP